MPYSKRKQGNLEHLHFSQFVLLVIVGISHIDRLDLSNEGSLGS